MRDSYGSADLNNMFTQSKTDVYSEGQRRVKKSGISDRKLVTEILKGNEHMLNYFYKHYYKSLFTYIKKKINDPDDAEEILQDVFFAVLEGMRDFAYKSSLFTFICSIANHKIIDFYRKKKIKKIVFSHFEGMEPLLKDVFGPEEALDGEILKEKIRVTFRKLSPDYQLILRLKYIYGFSVDEIAKKLSLTFKSAESQLFRARKAFALNFNI